MTDREPTGIHDSDPSEVDDTLELLTDVFRKAVAERDRRLDPATMQDMDDPFVQAQLDGEVHE